MTTITYGDALVRHTKERLNAEMLEAAEPLIQEALKKIEAEMRRQLAASLISVIEHRVAYYHDRQELVVHFGEVSRK